MNSDQQFCGGDTRNSRFVVAGNVPEIEKGAVTTLKCDENTRVDQSGHSRISA